MAGGRRVKEFQEYLTAPTHAHVGHDAYIKAPAAAFLEYAVEAKSTVDMCSRNLPTKNDGGFTSNSLDTLQNVLSAVLPSVMGHFETFQRYMFAGIFDRTVHLSGFSPEKFFKKLNGNRDVTVDVVRLAAHRNLGVSSVGILVADSLRGWHDPETVNRHFSAYFPQTTVFSNDSCEKLNVLWQLRHSIVHSGGTLMLPDAQKVRSLESIGETQIAFEKNFIFEVARKLHPIVKDATQALEQAFRNDILQNRTPLQLDDIDKFFEVKSPVAVWLR